MLGCDPKTLINGNHEGISVNYDNFRDPCVSSHLLNIIIFRENNAKAGNWVLRLPNKRVQELEKIKSRQEFRSVSQGLNKIMQWKNYTVGTPKKGQLTFTENWSNKENLGIPLFAILGNKAK